jgi:hypothetical protein
MSNMENFPQMPLKDQIILLAKLFLIVLFTYIIKAI